MCPWVFVFPFIFRGGGGGNPGIHIIWLKMSPATFTRIAVIFAPKLVRSATGGTFVTTEQLKIVKSRAPGVVLRGLTSAAVVHIISRGMFLQ